MLFILKNFLTYKYGFFFFFAVLFHARNNECNFGFVAIVLRVQWKGSKNLITSSEKIFLGEVPTISKLLQRLDNVREY